MPDYSYTSGKLNRSHLLHYIDANFGTGTASWYLILSRISVRYRSCR